jgi:Rad3-related DNA helicase
MVAQKRDMIQKEISEEFANLSNNDILMVESPTGSGKTYIALLSALAFKKKNSSAVIISTNTNFNALNIYDTCINKLNIPKEDVCVEIGKANYMDLYTLDESIEEKRPLVLGISTKELQETYGVFDGNKTFLYYKNDILIDDFIKEFKIKKEHINSNMLGQVDYREYDTKSIFSMIENIKDKKIIITNHTFLLIAYKIFARNKVKELDFSVKSLFVNTPIIMDEFHFLFDNAKSILNKTFSPFNLKYSLDGVVKLSGEFISKDLTKKITKISILIQNYLNILSNIPEGKKALESKKALATKLIVDLKSNLLDTKKINVLIKQIARLKERNNDIDHKSRRAIIELEELKFFSLLALKNTMSFSQKNYPTYTIENKYPTYELKKSFTIQHNAPFLGLSGTFRHIPEKTKESFKWVLERNGFYKESVQDVFVALSQNKELDDNIKELIIEKTDRFNDRVENIKTRVYPNLFKRNNYLYTILKEDEYERPYQNDFKEKGVEWIENLGTFIGNNISSNSLVLVGSYKDAESLSNLIKEQREDIEIFCANKNLPMTFLIDDFIQSVNSGKICCIVGTLQYFVGLDLKGKFLQELYIAKAPFLPPKNKIGKTKIGKLSFSKTENYEFTVLLHFLQGIGRPIRDFEDKAVCYILDKKILKKGRNDYKNFINEKAIELSYEELVLNKKELFDLEDNFDLLYAFFHKFLVGKKREEIQKMLKLDSLNKKEQQRVYSLCGRLLKQKKEIGDFYSKEEFNEFINKSSYSIYVLLFAVIATIYSQQANKNIYEIIKQKKMFGYSSFQKLIDDIIKGDFTNIEIDKFMHYAQ